MGNDVVVAVDVEHAAVGTGPDYILPRQVRDDLWRPDGFQEVASEPPTWSPFTIFMRSLIGPVRPAHVGKSASIRQDAVFAAVTVKIKRSSSDEHIA
jgi:hypothetical protein